MVIIIGERVKDISGELTTQKDGDNNFEVDIFEVVINMWLEFQGSTL